MSKVKTVSLAMLLIAASLSGGCSDKLGVNLPAEMPTKPFSIDCRLKNILIGNTLVQAASLADPAALRLQINPQQRYYRITQFSGELGNLYAVYKAEEDRTKPAKPWASKLLAIAPSSVPFVGSVWDQVQFYRYGDSKQTLYLEEADQVQFNGSHPALAYMSLDVVNRKLTIGVEDRQQIKDYDQYTRHIFSERVTASFACDRSPAGTVIEIDGFRQ